MDLYAYAVSQAEGVMEYIEKAYGPVPRMRGVRFMKVESIMEGDSPQMKMFNSMVGMDVVCIHTRCGSFDFGDYCEESNYIACGGKEFEERNGDTFICSVNDAFDSTYRDHYFWAVMDDDYLSLMGTTA